MPKSLAILQFAASFAAIVAAWRLSPFKSGRDSNPWWAAAFAALGLKFLFGGLFLLYGAKLPTGLMETLGGLALSLVVCGNSFADAAKTSGVALFACAALLFWGLLGWLLGVDPSYSSFPLYFLAFSVSIAGLIRKPHLKGGEGGVYLNLICAFLALIGLAGRYWSGLELFLVFAVLSGWFLVASLTLAITARRAAADVAFRVGGGMAVALLDPRGRVVFANGRTSLLAGFSPELATGRNFWELFGESQREAAKEWLKGGASGQLDLSTPEGSFIFEARDSFFGTIVAGRADGSSPGGCPDFFGASLRVDPDNGSILECPPDAAKLLGAEGEDMRGRSLWSFARAGRSAALREAIGSSLAGGGAFLATLEGA
ncbi:PAS domain-containing protein, partial [bacterium]